MRVTYSNNFFLLANYTSLLWLAQLKTKLAFNQVHERFGNNPPAAKFASQGDALMRTNTQIRFLYYPLSTWFTFGMID